MKILTFIVAVSFSQALYAADDKPKVDSKMPMNGIYTVEKFACEDGTSSTELDEANEAIKSEDLVVTYRFSGENLKQSMKMLMLPEMACTIHVDSKVKYDVTDSKNFIVRPKKGLIKLSLSDCHKELKEEIGNVIKQRNKELAGFKDIEPGEDAVVLTAKKVDQKKWTFKGPTVDADDADNDVLSSPLSDSEGVCDSGMLVAHMKYKALPKPKK